MTNAAWPFRYKYSDDESVTESESEYESELEIESETASESEPENFAWNSQWSRPEADIRSQIWSTLSLLQKPSAFAFSTSSASLPNPGLYIRNHGVVGLPLSSVDAQAIISKAKQSPFGKGKARVVDTSVRKCWELDSTRILLKNPEWARAIDTILPAITTGLDLASGAQKLTAELYNLLLYEPGAFPKSHKDCEKIPGMFGTLIICLPSPHQGGKVVLSDAEGGRYEFETDSHCDFDTTFAAWYSDITHEVRPVISGYRLVLAYNLVRRFESDGKPLPLTVKPRGRTQQLSLLLELYNTRLEQNTVDVPPYLVHKLKRKYARGSMKLGSLKGQDVSQVQRLSHLSVQLGFDIYLATSELEIVKYDDECEDYYGGYGYRHLPANFGESEGVARTFGLKSVVDLEGSLVFNVLHCAADSIIDPRPRNESNPYKEEESRRSATYWYRDSVVLLVPPCRKIDFLLNTNLNQDQILPLLGKLKEETSNDVSKKPQLERLCELVLKAVAESARYGGHMYHFGTSKAPGLSLEITEEVTSTALELGRFDLFDELSPSIAGQAILANASKLGEWAACLGLGAMKDRVAKGMQVACSMEAKLKYLKEVEDGIRSHEGASSDNEIKNVRAWLQGIMLETILRPQTSIESKFKYLAEISDQLDADVFEEKVKPPLLAGTTTIKLDFLRGIQKIWRNDIDDIYSSFKDQLIQSIWTKFKFDQAANLTDVKDLITLTAEFTQFFTFTDHMIPAFMRSIPTSDQETASDIFIPLVRSIVEDKDSIITFPQSTTPIPSQHVVFVQAMLRRYVKTSLGAEPRKPQTWRLPGHQCNCKDCGTVNTFLRHPTNTSLELSIVVHRRKHLDTVFTRVPDTSFDVVVLKDSTPFVWQIKKHRRGYEKSLKDWKASVEKTKRIMQSLAQNARERARLHRYLDPHWDSYMQVQVGQLPNPTLWQPLMDTNTNSKPKGQASTTRKRERAQRDVENDGPSKRTRSAEDTNSKIEVVDLTDF